MPNQFIKIIIVTLLFLFSQPLWADEIESEIEPAGSTINL